MADRIAIMNDGELQQFGAPLECYHNPTNQFVAGFLGEPSMNFFDVTFDGTTLANDGFSYKLSEETVNQYDIDADELVLGVRPEAIHIMEGPSKNTVEARVNVVEPMGNETIVYVEMGDKQCTLSVEGEKVTEEDETVNIYFDEEAIHLFDATTGDAIKTKRSIAA